MFNIESFFALRLLNLVGENAFFWKQKADLWEKESGIKVVHCEIGEPDFLGHPRIIEATKKSLDNQEKGYTWSRGLPDLLEELAAFYSKLGLKVSVENFVVLPGGKPVIPFTILALVNEGDEVIYPNPGYPIYADSINLVGAKPVPIPLREENRFRMDLDELKKLISPKTKILIINYPQNPTGGTSTLADLIAIAELAEKHNFMILADEIYRNILYEGEFRSIATLPGMQDRIVILDGLSKTYALTGYRVGWGIMAPKLAAKVTLLANIFFSCLPTFTQRGAVEALHDATNEIKESVQNMVTEFGKRKNLLYAGFNQAIPGLSCKVEPKGAFYIWVRNLIKGMSSEELANDILYKAGVAVLPGTAFGTFGEGYIRLSYANSFENLQLALERIKRRMEVLVSHQR